MAGKLICDSSCDLTSGELEGLITVPLKIITAEKEYSDGEELDCGKMLLELEKYKGKSRSSCPNPEDYLRAFGNAKEVFCVTITSGMSGSFNSAMAAAKEFEKTGGRALVIDSLTAGAETALIVEKLKQLTDENKSFEEVEREITEYKKRTHLSFALKSLGNLSKNGRVSPITAKLCGVLGIRVIGKASEAGTLEVTGKSRGEKNALFQIYSDMRSNGYKGGKVRIHHAQNKDGADVLRELITAEHPRAEIKITSTRGLCSFYAERGGLLVGYES